MKNKASEKINKKKILSKAYQINRISCDLLGSMHHIFGLSGINLRRLYTVVFCIRSALNINGYTAWIWWRDDKVLIILLNMWSVDLAVWSQSMMSTCPGEGPLSLNLFRWSSIISCYLCTCSTGGHIFRG